MSERNFVLFTDSDCDMTPAICAKYGYELISMPYTIDGKEVRPYIDFEEFDYKAFYGHLREGVIPTTSALSPVEYMNYFEPFFKAGKDILYVHFSAAMSATFNSMRLALEELAEKYPERKLYEVDTKGITVPSMAIAMQIGEMVNKGAGIEEVLEWAKTEVDHYACYFFADDLKFFGKSGRVSGIAAFMGGIIGIRPILTMNSEGKMVPVGKVKGRRNAVTKLVDYVQELGVDVEKHTLVIGHADAMHLVEEIQTELKNRFGNNLQFEVIPVNPTAGAHCGPDTLGIGFYAKHR